MTHLTKQTSVFQLLRNLLLLLFLLTACADSTPEPTPSATVSTAIPTLTPSRTTATPHPDPTPFTEIPIVESELKEGAIYVAPTGDDASPGTLQQPLRTIQAALEQVQPGETIYVRQGVYREAITLAKSGEPGRPITLSAYPAERPLIEGDYQLPTGEPARWNNEIEPPRYFVWGALVRIRASHVRFVGFEVQHSLGRAILISDGETARIQDIELSDCLVHDSRHSLVRIMYADNVTVQGCQFYHASDYATHSRSLDDLNWPAALATIDATNVIFRENIVHESWSSGISPGLDSQNVTIEKNIIYDQMGQQIYVHRSQGVTVRDNLIYHSNQPAFRRFDDPSTCIALNNEEGFDTDATVTDVVIEQNIFVGCKRNIGLWRSEGSGMPIENVRIVNNTLVNATSNKDLANAIGLFVAPGNFQNIRIARNVIVQAQGVLVMAPDDPAVTFRRNAWSAAPAPVAQSNSDSIGNFQLQNPNAPLVPGAVQPEWYMPAATSTTVLNNLGATDFYQPRSWQLPTPKRVTD
ncbi:MAG TPA: right-handed parallel beta-helix repeat-containing protein [Caldilineaceae bacterium]|nr:right-handed parallel beta-helix repeat-containing protein [Caldilineaceae bacterium]